MEHYLIRATIIPGIVKLISEEYGVDEFEALDMFYQSATGELLAEDDTGLYGQSEYYIFGLFRREAEYKKSQTGAINDENI